jgi:hypothetical protein
LLLSRWHVGLARKDLGEDASRLLPPLKRRPCRSFVSQTHTPTRLTWSFRFYLPKLNVQIQRSVLTMKFTPSLWLMLPFLLIANVGAQLSDSQTTSSQSSNSVETVTGSSTIISDGFTLSIETHTVPVHFTTIIPYTLTLTGPDGVLTTSRFLNLL